ncbi:solute carrier family 2, facilitated glucose transporter member 12 isoform X2 [Denticeps clupeoides]|uniref:solute carrier family 2, facilitated glucose transporter member 12 isoform X2 n=1 Tax=Denticeps clupeoides TaxID=299321 RepID=UPI0010A3DA81|nr:solute carrier family 2, facilitated glucose transporter member 12 isoform X2 [Denticeps clupeoides]
MTSSDPRSGRGTRTGCGGLLVLAALVASVSGLLLGYEMGLISGAVLQLRDALSLSCRSQELLVSSFLLGALLLSLAGGAILDRWGRKFAIVLTAVLVAAGTLVRVCGSSLPALVLGRTVVGMAVALSGTASCLYIAEVAPQAWRGRLVCLYELMVVLGVLLGFGLSWGFSGVTDGWRYTFAAALPPAVTQAVAMHFLPQSPRFLLLRGREKEARAVLTRLRGPSPGAAAVDEELRAIQAALNAERQHGFLDLFRCHDNMRQRLLVGVVLVFLQQMTGQPNLLSYASTVLHHMGFHSDQAATLASTGLGVVKVGGTIPAILLVDRVGSKAFLCVGAAVMTFSLTALGMATMQSHTQVVSLCQSPAGLNHTPWGRGENQAGKPVGLYQLKLNHTHLRMNPAPRTETSDTQVNGNRSLLEDIFVDVAHEGVAPSLKWISLVSLLVYVAAFSFSLGPKITC